MRKPKGVSFQPWSFCERCRFTYPLSQLIVQKGLRVCTRTCVDNLDIEYRAYLIEEILSDPGTEGQPITPEIYITQEEVLF